jgi:predicted ATP-dependent serine protease
MSQKQPLCAENLTDLFTNTEPPVWVLGGVLPESAIVLVSGLGHTSKTFLALDACLSVASGAAWMGHFPTRQGTALYVGEDSSRTDVVRQMRKLLIGREQASNPPYDSLFFAVCQGATLNTDNEAARIADLIFKLQPRLVVLDSLRFLTPGVDEDSSTEMSTVIDRVKGLRDILFTRGNNDEQSGPGILLIHHNSLGGRARGSTAIFDGVDGAINLSHNKKNDLVTAAIQKRRCIEVPEFAYHHLWDLERAELVVQDESSKPLPHEEQAVVQFFIERKVLTTADVTACLKANGKGFDKLSAPVLSNRVSRLLQKLKNSGKITKPTRGEWTWVGGKTG